MFSLYSLLLAVFGLAVRAYGSGGATRGTALFATFLGLGAISILIIVTFAIRIVLIAIHETVELGTEPKVELEPVNSVQVVKIIGDVVCLFKLLHDLVIVRVHFVILTVVDALRLLLRLEDVEEGVAWDRLNDYTLLSCLLVLLCLLHLLLGGILALFPVNRAADDLDGLVRVTVGDGLELKRFIGEELVLLERHRDGQLRVGQLDLTGVQLGQVFKNGTVLLSDDRLEHGVVLDRLGPEIRHAWRVFQVGYIGGRVSLGLFLISGLLLLCFDDASDCGLALGHRGVELVASVIELGQCTSENLVTLLKDGNFAPLEGLRQFAHFLFEIVIDFAALIGENMQASEAVLDSLGHSFDDLDHFLLHLALFLANLEDGRVLGGFSSGSRGHLSLSAWCRIGCGFCHSSFSFFVCLVLLYKFVV